MKRGRAACGALAGCATLALAACATLTLAACATGRALEAFVVVRAPKQAQIYVDDAPLGFVAGRTIGLRRGAHRIEVREGGHVTAYREVDLHKGDRVTLEVTLRPDLDRDDLPAPEGTSR